MGIAAFAATIQAGSAFVQFFNFYIKLPSRNAGVDIQHKYNTHIIKEDLITTTEADSGCDGELYLSPSLLPHIISVARLCSFSTPSQHDVRERASRP
jgi:hypothetical protein